MKMKEAFRGRKWESAQAQVLPGLGNNGAGIGKVKKNRTQIFSGLFFL